MNRPIFNTTSMQGFTILELLIVIAILSAVAFAVMGTVGEDLRQVRYNDTQNRLNAIRVAILGPTSPAVWDRGLQSGFVVDNGVLPESIKALVNRPDGYDTFGLVSPVFDSTPNANYNDGVDEEPISEYPLMKGSRGGYLVGVIDETFRDGWGTVRDTDDAENHGWLVQTDGDAFSVTSFGLDGKKDELAGDPLDDPLYEPDMAMTPSIAHDDWTVVLPANTSVTVTNLSGYAVGTGSSKGLAVPLKVALLVYENSANGGRWRQMISGAFVGQCAHGESMTFTLPSGARIPVGEHLLVLIGKDDVNLEDADTVPDNWSGQDIVARRIKFFSRGGVPEMTLEIR